MLLFLLNDKALTLVLQNITWWLVINQVMCESITFTTSTFLALICILPSVFWPSGVRADKIWLILRLFKKSDDQRVVGLGLRWGCCLLTLRSNDLNLSGISWSRSRENLKSSDQNTSSYFKRHFPRQFVKPHNQKRRLYFFSEILHEYMKMLCSFLPLL